MTDPKWSKVGKKSRRKGKSFECEVAKLFRTWFGHKWETSRNSGRTDIPGDIYCVDRPTRIMVECKHRANWSLRDIIRNNAGFRNNFFQVVDTFHTRNSAETYPILWIFRKDEYGLWVHQTGQSDQWEFGLVFEHDVKLVAESGAWHLIKGLRKDVTTRKIEEIVYHQ